MTNPTPRACPIPWHSPTHGPTPCGKPLGDREHVCADCARDFAGRLRTDVADALDALAVTIARGDRFRRDVVRRAPDDDHQPGDRPDLGAHGSVPFNVDAAKRRDQLDDEVARWARIAHTRWAPTARERAWHGIPWTYPPAPPAPPAGTAAAAAWLANVVEDLRHEPWLPTAVVRIDRRVRKALAVCDRPDDRVRVQCPTCGTDVPLSTDPDERIDCRGWIPTDDGTRVRCTEWGLQRWWVETCRPTTEPVRAVLLPLRLEAYGYHVTPGAVRNWVYRGQLKAVGTDAAGHPTYDLTQAAQLAHAKGERRRAVRHA